MAHTRRQAEIVALYKRWQEFEITTGKGGSASVSIMLFVSDIRLGCFWARSLAILSPNMSALSPSFQAHDLY